MFRAAKLLLSALSTAAVHHFQAPTGWVSHPTFVHARTFTNENKLDTTRQTDRKLTEKEEYVKKLLMLRRIVATRWNDFWIYRDQEVCTILGTGEVFGRKLSIDEELHLCLNLGKVDLLTSMLMDQIRDFSEELHLLDRQNNKDLEPFICDEWENFSILTQFKN